MPKFSDVIKGAFNVFSRNKDPVYVYRDLGQSSSSRPDHMYFFRGNDRTIINSIYSRIANDVAKCDVEHVRVNENEQYIETIDSGLNEVLTINANLDQTGRELIREAVLTMFEDGYVCFFPFETESDPDTNGSYDIYEMRVAKIVEWYPRHVRIKAYDENTGKTQELIVPKATVSIVENPFYAVMNSPNSILKRLVYKLNLLDVVDEQSSSGKLDLIIQLPYVIRTEEKKVQAQARLKEIESQLKNGKYGIAYTDGTEKITQLNRAVENNLLAQIEFLTSMLYGQLGLTAEIMNGTADEKTMLNYDSRTIEPIITAITEDMTRKFLTKTARSQRQRIKFFKDPFKLVPLHDLAEAAQIFTSGEILTSNEVRGIIGYKPVETERANSLINKNINTFEDEASADQEGINNEDPEAIQAELNALEENDRQLDEFEEELSHSDEGLVIVHYSSPYYDPVKAHEYYEQHKKLKGRNSGSGLNEKGKEVWYGVKTSLDNERKQNKEKELESRNSSITNNSEVLANRISNLRDQYAKLPASEKKARSRQFQRQIERLRSDNARAKEELQRRYNEAIGNIDANYEGKLTSEYESILADPNYQKKAKAKSSSRGGKSKKDSGGLESWTRRSDKKTKMYRKDL